MISPAGSGKWVFAVIFAILLVVTFSYPHQVWFTVKFCWDIIVLNVHNLVDPWIQRWHSH
jgi:hypothetical protein